jgi:hypothetical protein
MTPLPGPRTDRGTALTDEHAGRTCYEAFHEKMQPWLPPSPEITLWSLLPDALKQAWIAAAKAARLA